MKAFFLSTLLLSLSTMAIAEQQIFTDNYELSIPDDLDYHQAEGTNIEIVDSLKADITNIVHQAYQLRNFPLKPEKVLPKVLFQTPIIHIEEESLDVFVFTVDVPVPHFLRNALLSVWFSSDVHTLSDSGYYLRLHKERGSNESDVGIIIVRAENESDLTSPEINNIIRSFSTL